MGNSAFDQGDADGARVRASAREVFTKLALGGRFHRA